MRHPQTKSVNQNNRETANFAKGQEFELFLQSNLESANIIFARVLWDARQIDIFGAHSPQTLTEHLLCTTVLGTRDQSRHQKLHDVPAS